MQKTHFPAIAIEFLKFAKAHPGFEVRVNSAKISPDIELPRPDGTYHPKAKGHTPYIPSRLEQQGTLHPDEIDGISFYKKPDQSIIQISATQLNLSKKQMTPLVKELTDIIRDQLKGRRLQKAFNPEATGAQTLVEGDEINFLVSPKKGKHKAAIILTIHNGYKQRLAPGEIAKSDGYGTPDPCEYLPAPASWMS